MSQWFRQFKDGHTNVHDKDRSGCTSIMHDDLVEKVNNKIRENWQLGVQEAALP